MIPLRKPRKSSTAPIHHEPEKPFEANRPCAQLRHRSNRLSAEGKFSQCSIYRSAAHSFERFAKERKIKSLTFLDITVPFLKDYETWALSYGKLNKSAKPTDKGSPASLTTVSIYCEALRYVYSKGIEAGVVKRESFPFGNGKYTIARVSGTRQPRTKDEIQMISQYQPANEKESFFRDIWLFSFYSNGCNIKDLLNLKKSDVDMESRTFSFVREKSKNTSRTKQKSVEGILFDQTVQIIERWADPQSVYLFPVLSEKMSALDKENTKKYFILLMNRHMKQIAGKLGLKGDVNSYSCRHSFANIMMQSEVPLPMISAALGHARISTTETYLSKFSSEKRREYLQRLL